MNNSAAPAPHQPTTPTSGQAPGPTAGKAWSLDELRTSPHARPDKADRVRAMFASIAPSYDLNNRLHSLGMDRLWRRAAVRWARPGADDRCLDLACGTGDLTLALARSTSAEVVGLDFTPAMLDIARNKLRRREGALGGRVRFLEGDAMRLPFDDASFDVVTIAFGIRNVTEPAACAREMARVLRPGGRCVILEFDQPRFAPARWLNAVYCARVMPRTASIIAGDRSGAYHYLPKSVGTFMDRRAMLAMLDEAGLRDARARSLSLGICALYRAVKRSSIG